MNSKGYIKFVNHHGLESSLEEAKMSPYVICIFKLESVLDKMQNKSANFIHLTEMLHILKVLESNLHAGVLMPEKNPLLLGSETRPPWADILPTTLKKVLHVPVIKRKMRVQPWCIAWFHLRTVLKLGFQIILQFFIDFKCFKKRYSWNTIGKECLFMIRKIVDSWMYRYLLEDKVVVRRLQLEYLDESSKLFELLPSYISALDTGNYKEWKNMITSQSWEQYILHRTNGCSICQSEEDLMYFYTCGHISCNNCWTSMQQQNEDDRCFSCNADILTVFNKRVFETLKVIQASHFISTNDSYVNSA